LDSFDRCGWALTEPCLTYHDEEWGVPVRDDRQLFEMLTLEGAQAGLSWETVLKKREGYRRVFAGFDLGAVAQFGEADVERLMQDPGIIRNRGKILSTIGNAQRILGIQDCGGTFADFVWGFVDGKPLVNKWQTMSELPAQTDLSVRMSKELLKKGFRFVGPTICYSFMQAVGLVNDHTVNCFRHGRVNDFTQAH
jgi:DNA-3-methyladenine glycosylase I